MKNLLSNCLALFSLLVVVLLAPAHLAAQTATASKPEVSIEDLTLMLKPLRKDQLGIEAEVSGFPSPRDVFGHG